MIKASFIPQMANVTYLGPTQTEAELPIVTEGHILNEKQFSVCLQVTFSCCTKAALKAGQGTRLTKVSRKRLLLTSGLQVAVESEAALWVQVSVGRPVVCQKERQSLSGSEMSDGSSFHEEATLLIRPLHPED